MKNGNQGRLRPALAIGATVVLTSLMSFGLGRLTSPQSEPQVVVKYVQPNPLMGPILPRLDVTKAVRTPAVRVQKANPQQTENKSHLEKVESPQTGKLEKPTHSVVTKPSGSNLPSRGSEAGRNRVISSHKVVTTGYNAGVASTGKSVGDTGYGVTYSGVTVYRGKVSTISADKNIFPIGTLLDIPGYGLGVVADTGSAIKGNKLDLYFDETDQWIRKNWGKKTVEVKVLRLGDGSLTQEEFNNLQK